MELLTKILCGCQLSLSFAVILAVEVENERIELHKAGFSVHGLWGAEFFVGLSGLHHTISAPFQQPFFHGNCVDSDPTPTIQHQVHPFPVAL